MSPKEWSTYNHTSDFEAKYIHSIQNNSLFINKPGKSSRSQQHSTPSLLTALFEVHCCHEDSKYIDMITKFTENQNKKPVNTFGNRYLKPISI